MKALKQSAEGELQLREIAKAELKKKAAEQPASAGQSSQPPAPPTTTVTASPKIPEPTNPEVEKLKAAIRQLDSYKYSEELAEPSKEKILNAVIQANSALALHRIPSQDQSGLTELTKKLNALIAETEN